MPSFDFGALPTLPVNVIPTFSDGVAAAFTKEGETFVTSPNADYIPEVEHGLLTVHLRDDGRFGLADPIHAPQIFSWRYPYLCAILRSIPEHESLDALWRTPTVEDFIAIKGTVVGGFGRLSPAFLSPLDLLVSEMVHRARTVSSDSESKILQDQVADLRYYVVAMRQALDRLRYMAASFRDQVIQVAQLQRYWLLSNAFLAYYSRIRAVCSAILDPPDVVKIWIGAWTTDPKVVQHLMGLGIPVWFFRAPNVLHDEIRVRAIVIMSDARHITSVPFFGEEPLYRGLPGDPHLEATMRACDTYRDLSRTPPASLFLSEEYSSGRSKSQTSKLDSPASATSSRSRLPTLHEAIPHKHFTPRLSPYPKTKPGKPHPSQVRGRDKFAEFPHRWMPAAIPAWTRAMESVDRTEKARDANQIWGYWIPEPAALVSPTDPSKVERYVLNWLRAHLNWLYLLRVPGSSATKVGTQAWRQFLNGLPTDVNSDTRTGRRNLEARQIFGALYAEGDFAASQEGLIDWHDHQISQLSDDLAPKIIWKVFELGFRHELLAVDRFLRPPHTPRDRSLQADFIGHVFPEGMVHAVASLPSSHGSGLFATLPHRRINALNAFKDVLLRWPGCPTNITQHEPLRLSDPPRVIEEVEFNLACFYINTFFQLSGRAPIVPHFFPM